MPVSLMSLRRSRWLASLLLVVFALRALIPAGFMPGGNGDFTLRVCPEGFPVSLLAGAEAAHHHHVAAADGDRSHSADSSGAPAHDHKSWMSGHCAFGAAANAPSLCHSIVIGVASQTEIPRARAAIVPDSVNFRFRIAQARAPPSLI
jgi:hypothetical protein